MPLDNTGNIISPWTQDTLVQCAAASQKVRETGRLYKQQIDSQTVTPVFGQSLTVNIPVQPIGIISKFFVLVTTTITNPSGGSTLSRAPFAPANQLSLISYTDTQQTERHSVPGWIMQAVAFRRHRRAPGAALTTDSPSGFGSVIQPFAAPSSIAANASGTVRCLFEIPLMIGPALRTLKGGVFAGSTFATQSLKLTFNPNFCSSGSDPLLVGYTGSGTGSNAPTFSTTVTTYQEYWSDFDLGLIKLLDPDLSTQYSIQQTSFPNTLAANTDNFVKFANLRQFNSVVLAFDNGGTMNAGTDITNFTLRAANQTPLFVRDPYLHSYATRNRFGDDLPAGYYLFDFTDDPIITAAEGNTVLSIKPNSVNSNAQLVVGWEFTGIQSVLASAPGLAGPAR